MSTLTFDTLKFAQRLEKAGATREYAIAEAEALSEVFESGTQELATKADLKADLLATRTDLKADISQLRAEMRKMELRMTIKLGGMIAASIAVTAALVKLL
ncbi:MAG: coiled-coil domain-containing protein [Gallionella sp.]|jgi:hypothetical protein